MNEYLSRPELRSIARQRLAGSWGRAVLITLIYIVICAVLQRVPGIGGLLEAAASGVLVFGMYRFCIGLVRRRPQSVATLFDGFSQFTRVFVLWLLIAIFTLLWTLLFIIPGIIAALRYSQAYLILNDDPCVTPMEAINRSKALMDGHKGRLFVLHLSFIGWMLLAIVTFGIGLLWLMPYMMTTTSAFYEDLTGRAANGVRSGGHGQPSAPPPAPGSF